MKSNRTKKITLITATVLLALFVAILTVLLITRLSSQNKNNADTAIVEATSPAAINTIDELAAYASSQPSLSQLAVSAPNHTVNTTVFAANNSAIVYELPTAHSLTIGSDGALTAEARAAITESLATFFKNNGVNPVSDSATSAVIARYANDEVYCSAQGPVGSPSITISCENAEKVTSSIASTDELIGIANATNLEKSYVSVKSVSDDEQEHTVTLINLSTNSNILTGSLLFTQSGADTAKYIDNLVSSTQGQAGGKVNDSEATKAVSNDATYGPLLSRLLGKS